MRYLPVSGKVAVLLFTAVFLVACSGNDTKEADEQAAREAAARQAEQQAQAQASAEANSEMKRLQDAAASFGSVFYFDYDSSALRADSREALDAHVALLRTSNNSVRLEGHTDERGTRDYNMALGERRANAIRDYLVVNGVASHRIEPVSYGEERPLAYGSGDSNWSQNRRVELK